jgi:gamma-glutamyltranspeptidase/glutathione hydrolase
MSFFPLASPLLAQRLSDQMDRSQTRSMVVSKLGIVAASQALASQAGAQILAQGGSAVDAAIAANAVLGVVEPMMDGIGGDLFAIEWDAKSGKLSGLNSSGWAPQKLTPELLKEKGFDHMPGQGIFSVTVPGCVRGWEALHKRFGKLPWADLFRPAVYYAQNGFPVTEVVETYWRTEKVDLERDLNGRCVFLINGETPKVGEVFRNPEYARALELIARDGPDAFYRGAIAKAILKTSERLGGVMTAADLGDFQAEWVEPISTTYRGWTVYELPPNGQGMAVLEMLNIFERFPLHEWGFANADSFHVKLEAQKLAYADLRRYNAEYAAERAAIIDMKHAHCDVEPGDPAKYGNDTVYLTAVDKEGNIVSLIQSVASLFGSGVIVDDFGFPLQNRGSGFVLDPNHPNVLAPRKRPFHTIIPGFMEKGDLHIGFGIMGGLNQPQAHAQFVSNVVDSGMNIQAALDAPRFTKLSFGGCKFMIEGRVPAGVREALIERGHPLDVRGDYSSWFGGGQVVMHDSSTGINFGASSPRKDGAAIPEPSP